MDRSRRARMRRLWWWRWRRNPMRRGSDVAEAWLVLIAWGLAGALGGFVGAVAADAVEQDLARARAERHQVTAVLVEDAPDASKAAGVGQVQVWATVRWRGAGGVARTGEAGVEPNSTQGSSVTVWTDKDGSRLLTAPVSAADARLEAGLLGGPAAAATAGLVLVAGHLVRRRLDRRRMAQWDAEWEQVGPQWRKRTR
ncbi:hypothetical protein ACIBUY_42325 [Streptomyces sp. NPDC050085]|uniref:Rv1733c family protein n=1 Tax=Streptomyces sp. NPDC050085 TaxID=3365600 RepID=UPI00378B5425